MQKVVEPFGYVRCVKKRPFLTTLLQLIADLRTRQKKKFFVEKSYTAYTFRDNLLIVSRVTSVGLGVG